MAQRSSAKKAESASSGALDAAKWPASKVELRSVKDLVVYARNARTHSAEQVAQIAASMQANGWTIPILIDERGVIIAGHGRLMAANKLRLQQVPVMVALDWSEDQKRAYRLADNQIPMNAAWDMAMLRTELVELKTADYPVKLLGFDDMQFVSFLSGAPVDPNAEWAGMPGFGPPEKQWCRSMTVYFKTPADVKRFVKKLGIAITDDTKTLFFPKPAKRDVKEFESDK